MAITVTIPTALRRFADNQASVEVQGKTISEVLDNLTKQHAALRPHLYADDGRLRNFVRVYVNDEDIRLKGDDAPVSEKDEIAIVPSIAGGVASAGAGRPTLSERGLRCHPGPQRSAPERPDLLDLHKT